ncbi:transporter substrate-binding domain-containing protein [Marinobacteraceae bacterium S3BR75-40.1]
MTGGICSLVEAHTLRFRTLENPPLEYHQKGLVVGLAADLIREAVKRTGHTAQIKIRPWKRVLLEVSQGMADAAFNAGRSAEREEWGLFSEEMLVEERYVLFSKQHLNLPADLSGIENLVLGKQLGYFYGERFMQVLAESRFKNVQTKLTITQCLELLMAERTDVFVGDWMPTLYYLRKMEASDHVFPVRQRGSDEPLVVSVSPTFVVFSRKTVTPEYVREFDRALRAMKADGTYAAIVRSYGYQVLP